MRTYIEEIISIAANLKIKPPTPINSGLSASSIIFLGAERRVTKIPKKKNYFSIKSFLNMTRSAGVRKEKTLGATKPHQEILFNFLASLWSDCKKAFADLNGLETRP